MQASAGLTGTWTPGAWPSRLRGPGPALPRRAPSLAPRPRPRTAPGQGPAFRTPRPGAGAAAPAAPAPGNNPRDRADRIARSAPNTNAAPVESATGRSDHAGGAAVADPADHRD